MRPISRIYESVPQGIWLGRMNLRGFPQQDGPVFDTMTEIVCMTIAGGGRIRIVG